MGRQRYMVLISFFCHGELERVNRLRIYKQTLSAHLDNEIIGFYGDHGITVSEKAHNNSGIIAYIITIHNRKHTYWNNTNIYMLIPAKQSTKKVDFILSLRLSNVRDYIHFESSTSSDP